MRRSVIAGVMLGSAASGSAAGLFLVRTLPQSAVAVAHGNPTGALASTPSLTGRVPITSAQLREAIAAGLTDRPIKSILNVRSPLTYGEFVWNDQGVRPGPVWIRIDLGSQILSVFRSGHEIGTAVILYGADGLPTPTGKFPILAKLKDHRSATYGTAPMPYTLRLTPDGVSIHGSDVRPGYATHGCVGVPKAFAAKLFETASKGDEVLIVAADNNAGSDFRR